MSTYTIYRVSDGKIVSHFSGSKASLEINVPEGHAALEGRIDPRAFEIDVEKKEARPLERSIQDERDQEISEAEDAFAAAGIQILEAQQGRAVREALLSLLPAGPMKDRLQAIDDQIAQRMRPLVKKKG